MNPPGPEHDWVRVGAPTLVVRDAAAYLAHHLDSAMGTARTIGPAEVVYVITTVSRVHAEEPLVPVSGVTSNRNQPRWCTSPLHESGMR